MGLSTHSQILGIQYPKNSTFVFGIYKSGETEPSERFTISVMRATFGTIGVNGSMNSIKFQVNYKGTHEFLDLTFRHKWMPSGAILPPHAQLYAAETQTFLAGTDDELKITLTYNYSESRPHHSCRTWVQSMNDHNRTVNSLQALFSIDVVHSDQLTIKFVALTQDPKFASPDLYLSGKYRNGHVYAQTNGNANAADSNNSNFSANPTQ